MRLTGRCHQGSFANERKLMRRLQWGKFCNLNFLANIVNAHGTVLHKSKVSGLRLLEKGRVASPNDFHSAVDVDVARPARWLGEADLRGRLAEPHFDDNLDNPGADD